MRSKALFSMLVIAPVIGACASYEPTAAVIPPPSDFQMIEVDRVLAGALPYMDTQQQEAMFDADFNASFILAINVAVENRREEAILVRPTDATLNLPDGRNLVPSSALKVANKVGEDGSVVGAAIAFGIIGLIASQNAEEKARAARVDDYESKSLHTTELRQGDTATGFMFFLLPKSSPGFDAAELSVRFIDPTSAQNWIVQVPLDGLKIEPTS